ncbi:MAG: hypothetical protein AUI15_02815 [Actinobacteria bacterium 13_2_20CM_2_66_6]|nr:MAG: hypothetical protein AUI15_02815 [Actinobacteria bacterium 13_2_20CM_2_66_6]
MGSDLLEDDEVSALCDRCAAQAGIDLRRLLTTAGEDELRLTQNAQPALCFMGKAMADAVPAGTSSMAAVLGLEAARIETALAGIDEVWPANYNTPTQTVIAGTTAGLERSTQALQAAGAKRVVPLNVSAAFHTPLMAPAAELLRAALDRIEWRAPRVAVIANLTGRPHQGADRIPHVMEMQLRSPVQWASCVASLVEMGCDAFVEVGPRRALTGMMRELAPGKSAVAVGSPEAARELALAD